MNAKTIPSDDISTQLETLLNDGIVGLKGAFTPEWGTRCAKT